MCTPYIWELLEQVLLEINDANHHDVRQCVHLVTATRFLPYHHLPPQSQPDPPLHLMPVLPEGFEAWVEVDGTRVQEYEIEEREDVRGVFGLVCWIASVAGKVGSPTHLTPSNLMLISAGIQNRLQTAQESSEKEPPFLHCACGW